MGCDIIAIAAGRAQWALGTRRALDLVLALAESGTSGRNPLRSPVSAPRWLGLAFGPDPWGLLCEPANELTDSAEQ